MGSIISSKSKWRDFFERHYKEEVNQLAITSKKSLSIEYSRLIKYDVNLWYNLVENPSKVLNDASNGLELVTPSKGKSLKDITIRITKVPQKLMVKELGEPDRINTLVSIDGNVRKIAGIHPRLVVGAFECARCGNVVFIPQEGHGNRQLKPAFCSCNQEKKGVFRFNQRESTFEKYQHLLVQESYEHLPAGVQPASINVELTNDLTGKLIAGQRVVI